MSEPFLILHKVRGEPAFDIAIRFDSVPDRYDSKGRVLPYMHIFDNLPDDFSITNGAEEDPPPWWIIPTSGLRAYPWKNWKLEELTNPLKQDWPPIDSLEEGCPEDWPDHYACNHSPKPTGGMGQKLIEMLGLTKREPRRS